MKGLKQFGAMALAAAMVVTLVAPLNARADFSYVADERTDDYDTDISVEYQTDEDGELSIKKYKSETYKNRVTGDTYTYNYETEQSSGDYNRATTIFHDLPKSLTIGTADFGYYNIDLAPGSTLSSKVKVTKGKKNITLKEYYTYEGTTLPSKDPTTKQWYFRKQDGSHEIINLPENPTQAEREAVRRKVYRYRYRIYGKKPGTAELKFAVTDASGAKKKYKVKITVSDDARAFTSITYAGKALQLNLNKGGNNNSFYAVQSSNKNGNDYVTKKAGKLSCKMGKNYKFIAAYVIKPNAYTTKTTSGTNETTTELVRVYSKGIDLNGDGDFEDTINGIRESDYANKSFVKVRNNKKIKLNTSADKEDYKWSHTGQYPRTTQYKSEGAFAETEIIIVYQSKVTKKFFARKIGLNLKVAKK